MKKIIGIMLALVFVLPASASAASISELQAQISSLLAQIQQLQAQLSQQTGQSCLVLTTDLQIGSSGDSVGSLQKTLEREGFDVSNSEVANHRFGESTASAVVGFQEKYRSEVLTPAGLYRGTGYVGTRTRNKLNALMSCVQTSNSTNLSTTDSQAARSALQAILDYDRTHVGEQFTSNYINMFSSEDKDFLSTGGGKISDVGTCTISSNNPSSSNGALVFKVNCTVDVGSGSYLMVKESGVWKMAFSRSLKYSIEQEQANVQSIPSDPNGYVDLVTDIKVGSINANIDDGTVKIIFTVKNIGTKSVINQQMKEEIFSGPNKKYLISSGWYPISVAAGQTWEHSFLWKDLKCDKFSSFCFNDAGSVEFYYGINMDKQVTETNYSNNYTVKNIYFTKTTGTTSNRTPSTPTISGPTSVTAGQSNLFSVVSTDPDGDAITYKFNWGDGTADISKTTASGYSSSIYHSWPTNGIYTITVSADDGKGGLASVSTLSVKVSVPVSVNDSPSSPTISGPTSVMAGQSNLYTAVATDPNNDNITYTFDWGDGTQDSKTFGSGYGYSVYHSWLSSGIYQVTVYAADGKGGTTINTLLVKVSAY